jgi:hypothetical protein
MDTKIDNVIESMNRLGLKVQLLCSKRLCTFKVKIVDSNNVERGHFSFDSSNGRIGSGEPIFLTIYLDEDLRGQNLSWLMVGTLITMLKEYIDLFRTSRRQGSIGLGPSTILGIDADASGSEDHENTYWDNLGLVNGKYSWDKDMPRSLITSETPFEKSTTLDALSHKILGKSFLGGGKKQKLNNKQTKRKQKQRKYKKKKSQKKHRRSYSIKK